MMEYKEYLNQMKEIHQQLVDYFDNNDENNIDLIQFFSDLKKDQTPQQIEELLHLISKSSNNHHRSSNFFEFFERFLDIYKDEILKNFSNRQIFFVFSHNKRILLTLFEKEILKPEIFVFKTFMKFEFIDKQYLNYFYPEMKRFINENKLKEINEIILQIFNHSKFVINPEEIEQSIELFEQKRRKGENDNYLCELIQNDEVVDFVSFVNRTNYSLASKISPSIYETNPFLLKRKETSLIEYSAFFGAIQIFKYLFMNGIELTQSLWLYLIHGKNPELIHFLEENKIIPDFDLSKEILIESIKCHHNEFANYIQNEYVHQEFNDFISVCRKYHNYYFFPDELQMNSNDFYDFCVFDYIYIIELILDENDVNLSDFNDIKTFEKEIYEKRINNMYKIPIKIMQTPFQAAFKKGNSNIVKLLFKKVQPFDINELLYEKAVKDPLTYAKTYLSIAVQNYDIDMVKYLLENTKADINMYSLILYNSNPHYLEMTPLIHSIINEYVQMIELLLSQENIDVNKKSQLALSYKKNEIKSQKTPLYHAVESQNFEVVNTLISREDININETCIDNDCIDLFLHLEAPVLIKSIILGDTKIFNLLLSRNEINKDCIFKYRKNDDHEMQEKEALYLAVELQRKEIVSILSSLQSVDVNKINIRKFDDKNGYYETSPLYIACECKDADIARSLLRRNDIDINFKSKYQSMQGSWTEYREKSCLHHAIDKENIDVIRILLENPKLNVNDIFLIKRNVSYGVCKIEEKTALHLAVEKNSPEIVSLLLTRKDLQINFKYLYCRKFFSFYNIEKVQTTAIHMAVKKNSSQIVRLLLNYNGIDLSIKDESGKMPIDIAQNREIKDMLEIQLKK